MGWCRGLDERGYELMVEPSPKIDYNRGDEHFCQTMGEQKNGERIEVGTGKVIFQNVLLNWSHRV